jgi:hypothetical protein
MTTCRDRLFVFWFVVLVVGCRDDGRLSTYKVTGKVVLSNGTPLQGGWIVCESPQHGLAARGVIDTDGTFRLGTFEQSDGAVAGKHRVAITPATPAGYHPDQGRLPPTIDRRFMHMDTSGLEFEVTPAGVNHFEITVQSLER